jgi:hypothetical protein
LFSAGYTQRKWKIRIFGKVSGKFALQTEATKKKKAASGTADI